MSLVFLGSRMWKHQSPVSLALFAVTVTMIICVILVLTSVFSKIYLWFPLSIRFISIISWSHESNAKITGDLQRVWNGICRNCHVYIQPGKRQGKLCESSSSSFWTPIFLRQQQLPVITLNKTLSPCTSACIMFGSHFMGFWCCIRLMKFARGRV